MIWPVAWPASANPDSLDPEVKARAELFAANTLRMLTLYRVGGEPITVMPCTHTCHHPNTAAFSLGVMPFHPILLGSGSYANCWCGTDCTCASAPTVILDAPVGRIDSVVIDGIALSPDAYHVEDGNRLVRTDGKGWPACSGKRFTVTYLKGYPVDSMGEFVAGVLAVEYLKLIGADKAKCRLPSSVTNVQRQGLTFEIARGMFPDGLTGITEVDTFIVRWNPHGLKTKPMVYSPDIKRQHAVTWRPSL
jgi:hypothetical protein